MRVKWFQASSAGAPRSRTAKRRRFFKLYERGADSTTVKSGMTQTLWLVALAPVLGALAAVSPAAVGAVAVVLALVAAGLFLVLRPEKALIASFFLLLLAETKFRARDPHDLLAGEVDAQIFFELALYAVMSLVVLANLRALRLRGLRLTSSEAILGCYVLLALTSSLWSPDPRITAVRAGQLVILYAVCLLAVRVMERDSLRMIAYATTFYVLVFALLVLIFPWASGARITYAEQLTRFSWFAVHPGVAGNYAAIAALFWVLAIFIKDRVSERKRSWLLGIVVIGLVTILVATRTRGQLVAFIVALLVLWSRRYFNHWTVGLAGYLGLILVTLRLGFGVSLAPAVETVLDQDIPIVGFLLRGQSPEEFLSVTGRVELWSNIYGLFLDRPLLGYGYCGSRKLLLSVLPWAGHAHNAVAESLLDLGLVGAGLLWFVVGRTVVLAYINSFLKTRPLSWNQAAAIGVLLYLLILSFTSPTFAGIPGYDALLFFIVAFGQERLKLGSHEYVDTVKARAGTKIRMLEGSLDGAYQLRQGHP